MSNIREQNMPFMADVSTCSRSFTAFGQGKQAFLADLPRSANPYQVGERSRIDWLDGWNKTNMAHNPNFSEIPGTLKQGEKGIKYKYSAEAV